MQYLTKEKFIFPISFSEDFSRQGVLVFEPENSLLEIYVKYFSNRNFVPYVCRDLDALHNAVNSIRPRALVMGLPEYLNFSEVLSKILFIKNKFSFLPIISYAYNLPSAQVKQLMTSGINSHLDRKFSQPRDLVDLVEALLN